MKIEFFETIDSTNTYLYGKALDKELCDECAVCADMQTAGKGRQGRSFYSPQNTGLYLSFLLFPDMEIDKIITLTPLTAVAAALSVKEMTDLDIKIKWVNDLYLEGKKVSGILTESSPYIKDKIPSFVVVGIGINIIPPKGGFPDEIRNIAGALFDTLPDRYDDLISFKRDLAQRITDRFYPMYKDPSRERFISEYRSLSMLDGKTVSVVDGPVVKVLGIEDDFGLKVMDDDGNISVLKAGEVSLLL